MEKIAIRLAKSCVLKLIFISMIFTVASALAFEFPDFKSVFKYGSLKRSMEITRTFESYEVLPNYTYYYSGWGNIPYAIIGIDKNYRLRQGSWKEIDITTQILRNWVPRMDFIYGYRPYGSQILDPDGKQVGIWYSSKQWTTVLVEGKNEIAVFSPEPPGFRGGK
jgi:hypothetical protein